MAYSEDLARRVRKLLDDGKLSEKKMFGGLCFLLRGNMLCGILDERLILRLGKEGAQAALAESGVREMDFTGRPMSSMVYVESPAIANDEDLSAWLDRARDFVDTLPAKA